MTSWFRTALGAPVHLPESEDKATMSMKTAAIYARVSSDQQKEDKTIASQTAALVAFASSHGYGVPDEWIFEDEGFSGATLVRPGLERGKGDDRRRQNGIGKIGCRIAHRPGTIYA